MHRIEEAQHNAYHDVESLFWVSLFLIVESFAEVGGHYGCGTAEAMKADVLSCPEVRDATLDKLLADSHPSLPKAFRRKLVRLLAGACVALAFMRRHNPMEGLNDIPMDRLWPVYDGLALFFDEMIKLLRANGSELDELMCAQRESRLHLKEDGKGSAKASKHSGESDAPSSSRSRL